MLPEHMRCKRCRAAAPHPIGEYECRHDPPTSAVISMEWRPDTPGGSTGKHYEVVMPLYPRVPGEHWCARWKHEEKT